MALPPQDHDSFVREVDENLRRDQARDFAKAYGNWILGALLLFLAIAGGLIWYKGRQADQARADGEQLAQVIADIGTGKDAGAPAKLDTLAAEGNDVIRASAALTRAALALQNNDRKTALAIYDRLAADDGLPKPYRDVALIRATTLDFDALKPDVVIERMKPLAVKGDPWFGSAGELTAMALLKKGDKAAAGRLFGDLAATDGVPASIRSRASQIASTLGVDASASLPADLQ